MNIPQFIKDAQALELNGVKHVTVDARKLTKLVNQCVKVKGKMQGKGESNRKIKLAIYRIQKKLEGLTRQTSKLIEMAKKARDEEAC